MADYKQVGYVGLFDKTENSAKLSRLGSLRAGPSPRNHECKPDSIDFFGNPVGAYALT